MPLMNLAIALRHHIAVSCIITPQLFRVINPNGKQETRGTRETERDKSENGDQRSCVRCAVCMPYACGLSATSLSSLSSLVILGREGQERR